MTAQSPKESKNKILNSWLFSIKRKSNGARLKPMMVNPNPSKFLRSIR